MNPKIWKVVLLLARQQLNSLACVNVRPNPIYSNKDNLNVLERHFKRLIPLATSSIEKNLVHVSKKICGYITNIDSF